MKNSDYENRVNLNELLKKSVEDSENLADEKEVEIKLETIEEDMSIIGGLPPGKVFSALLRNNIRKSDCSELRILTEEKNGEIMVGVEDDGDRIPKKSRKNFPIRIMTVQPREWVEPSTLSPEKS